jgi:predicted metal-binding membrane protein
MPDSFDPGTGDLGSVVLESTGGIKFSVSEGHSSLAKDEQTPAGVAARYWRSGGLGVFEMGLRHGLFCVGCCWAAMLFLFVGGLMNMLGMPL